MDTIIIKRAPLCDLYVNLFVKVILKKSGRKRIFSSSREALRELERMGREAPEDISFPINARWKSFAGREEFGGAPLYRFSCGKPGAPAMLYLHGGAFVNPPNPRHFKMVDRLCRQSGYDIYFPVYPKAPVHKFNETYGLVESLYLEMLKTRGNEDIVFAGDSAGAMLCVTLCGEFKKKNIPLPKKLVLYSLVAETALDNPEIAKIFPKDPMQGTEGLREYVKAWSGDEPLSSPLINPMSADLSVLPETVMFTGMNEIFCPDVRAFAEKARNSGADVTCYLFTHMYHCFPLFDLLSAKKVRDMTCEILK